MPVGMVHSAWPLDPSQYHRYTVLTVRSLPLKNLRAQTGLIFFAGLLSLVVITLTISVIVGNTIREDDARLVALVATGPSDTTLEEAAAIRQRRDGDIGMVRGMYGGLFLSSLVFLLIGLWFIQQIIVAPIEALDQMARRIAAGDLETPTTLGGSSEFQELAHSFEIMRLELRAASARQAEWAAQLEERVQRRTEELAQLNEEMRRQAERVAALQERERIAMELHDGLLQTLGYLYLKTDQAEALADQSGTRELARELSLHREVLEQASQEVRRFIVDLSEVPPPPTSLSHALTNMIDDLGAEPGAIALPRIEFKPGCDLVLPAEWVTHLTRIAREALINAVQHGHAKAARISCHCSDGQGQMCIEDSGAGFDLNAPRPGDRPHFGLSVMKARAARIGAVLTIDSAPAAGTTVLVRWPMPNSESEAAQHDAG